LRSIRLRRALRVRAGIRAEDGAERPTRPRKTNTQTPRPAPTLPNDMFGEEPLVRLQLSEWHVREGPLVRLQLSEWHVRRGTPRPAPTLQTTRSEGGSRARGLGAVVRGPLSALRPVRGPDASAKRRAAQPDRVQRSLCRRVKARPPHGGTQAPKQATGSPPATGVQRAATSAIMLCWRSNVSFAVVASLKEAKLP
jgi:hypothetical protein